MSADSQKTREISIWRCAMARISSRKVDTKLSIMDLFDVQLNPRHYDSDDDDDLLRATIDLCKLQGDIARKRWQARGDVLARCVGYSAPIP